MTVTCLRAADLTPDHLRLWGEWQRADPALESPFFRPEFARVVDAARGGVEVAVLEEGGRPCGFLPFHRGRLGAGRPVGWPMSDYQGLVAPAGVALDPAAVVRGCGLSYWDFDHVPAAQAAFAPHHWRPATSPYLDLSAGFEGYMAARKKAGSTTVNDSLRKLRKLEREVGPVRVELHTTAPAAFAALLDWKAAQYGQTGLPNLFAAGWPVKLLEGVLAERGNAFSGLLSAVYFGDRLGAVHLGVRSFGVLHSWFPAYDREFSKYSPGVMLVVELAKLLPGLGVTRLDLGKGDMEYKTSLMSGSVPLAEGCVAAGRTVDWTRRRWDRTKRWAKTSRYGGPLRAARRVKSWLAAR